MVELKGSLAAIGLPAIVQLIGDLHHSGTLELYKSDSAPGILGFDHGRLVSAEFEQEQGMPALEACTLDLRDAEFRFVEGVAVGQRTLDIAPSELRRLIARIANGEPITEAPATISGDELRAAGVCPSLGFADDPARHYSRPTALHRCYATQTPSLVTNGEQLDLCLGGLYPTCERFRNAVSSESLRPSVLLPPQKREETAPPPPADAVALNRNGSTRASQDRRVALAAYDDAPARAGGLREILGGLVGGRRLAAMVGLVGVGLLVALPTLGRGPAPSRPPVANPAAAALVTPTFAAAAQTMATAPIAAAGQVVAAQPTAPVPIATAGQLAVGQPTAPAPLAAAAPVEAAAAAAPTPAQASHPSTAPTVAPLPTAVPRLPTPPAAAPLTAPAGARSVMDVRFSSGPADNWLDNPPVAGWGDGAYRLQTRQPAQFVAVAVPLVPVTSDVVVSATFRKTGGPPGGGYGVIVRDQGPLPRDGLNQEANAYVLAAGDLGEFGVWRRAGDHWVDLVPWTRSSSVRPGGSPNDLMVRAVGDSLTLTINGARVASIQDDTLPTGAVGIFVGGDYNEVALDHFAVQLPE